MCTICPAGYFQPNPHLDPNIECQNCDAGLYIADDSQNDAEHVACKFCQAGRQFVSTTEICSICEAGKYQNANNIAAVSCTLCIGRYITDASQTVEDHDSIDDCKFCVVGKRFVSIIEECTICAAGKYQDANTMPAVSCKECVGTYILDASAVVTEHDSIDDCKFCVVGKKFNSITEECVICEAGKYQDTNNVPAVSCQSCIGLFILNDGTDETKHDSINDCQYCTIGKKFVSISQECSICDAGKYQDSNTVANVVCQSCSGKVIEDDSQTVDEHDSIDDCKYCTIGKGFKSISKCQICDAGKYQTANNNLSPPCISCEAGLYLVDLDTGPTVNEHDTAADCKYCSAGKAFRSTSTECTVCEYSKYQDQSSKFFLSF